MKNNSFSIPEVLLVFLIINITLVVFLRMASDYLRTLIFSKELFILNSALNEKYQTAIAYKNIAYVFKNTSSLVFNTGLNYCFNFNTSSYKIVVSSSNVCEYKFLNGENSGINYKINFTKYIQLDTNISPFDIIQILDIKITASSSKNNLIQEMFSSLISAVRY